MAPAPAPELECCERAHPDTRDDAGALEERMALVEHLASEAQRGQRVRAPALKQKLFCLADVVLAEPLRAPVDFHC